ncbi:hypothetical protein W97_07942 [Coniosporium apollinis CBS 100218]|uniref:Peptidase M20 dimerisation domain-containing protein n=1 Tax=Coniosporium apollinis (strain CBS 100218) TaxID=1168221 RepID=R7Z3U5_CONA1|nr:uncharacterized protein W97_07942 [Coniosporium apollinis CBS 100218]EON68684.1 hypothetical protein W97_07942 [Coniosporium apollinis CBS 100218]
MPAISNIIKAYRPDLSPYESLYKHFHSHPELSFQEKDTAAGIQAHLKKLGSYSVHPNIGGTGTAAVLENGTGTTVLLRADIDALPVEENTGLPYASRKRMKDADGVERPVMHACGHDMHFTSLLAAAELLLKAKDEWQGTLVLCFQPAEEKGAGAQAMVDDGLYDRVPVPDVVLGAHVVPYRSAGTIGTRRGLMSTAADSFHCTLYGRGGHASQPHQTIDPVVMAASTVMRLQTIRSREINPAGHAVVSVGSLRAGDTENIIPDRAELKINVRTMDAKTRERVLGSLKRIIEAESTASNAPKPPELKEITRYPFGVNDEDVTAKLENTFSAVFEAGPHGYQSDIPPMAASEDFGILASAVKRPASFFVYGGTDPDAYDKAEKEGRLDDDIPNNHSPFFAPVVQPTMTCAVDGYAAAALTWLVKE